MTLLCCPIDRVLAFANSEYRVVVCEWFGIAMVEGLYTHCVCVVANICIIVQAYQVSGPLCGIIV